MEMTPQRVRSAEFKSIRKGGMDPDEVRAFLADVADELERAQNQATAMEARARAAVARLQEVGEPQAAKPAPEASVDETETISRTLLLAQRTADTTIAEAKSEAERIVVAANEEAAATRDSTREMAAQLLDEARFKARQATEAERLAAASEVEALKARRDFLESDVSHLQLFLTDQRTRIRDAATSLLDITERVPGGLADVRAPLLSASDDDSASSGGDDGDLGGEDDLVIQTDIADIADEAESSADRNDATPAAGWVQRPPAEDLDATLDDDEYVDVAVSDDRDDDDRDDDDRDDHHRDDHHRDDAVADPAPWSDERDDPTQAMPAVETAQPNDDSGGFRFSFDDER